MAEESSEEEPVSDEKGEPSKKPKRILKSKIKKKENQEEEDKSPKPEGPRLLIMMMMHKLQQSAVYNWLQVGGSDHLHWSGGIRLYNRISSVHSAIPCVMMLFSVGFLS